MDGKSRTRSRTSRALSLKPNRSTASWFAIRDVCAFVRRTGRPMENLHAELIKAIKEVTGENAPWMNRLSSGPPNPR